LLNGFNVFKMGLQWFYPIKVLQWEDVGSDRRTT
jgi:hypothetical protein